MNLSADSLKDVGIEVATNVANEIRHLRSNQRARRALRGVENQRGRTDSALIDRCNEYAQDVLGSRKFAPWLQVYAAVSGEFRERWIPDNYYGVVVDPRKNPVAVRNSALRPLTNRIINDTALQHDPHPHSDVYYSADSRNLHEEREEH